MPLIVEAERSLEQTTDSEVVFRCAAVGNPLPIIRWTVVDTRNDAVVPLVENVPGIEITNTTEPNELEASSELRIGEDANFHEPTCIAENVFGSDMRTESNFTIIAEATTTGMKIELELK